MWVAAELAMLPEVRPEKQLFRYAAPFFPGFAIQKSMVHADI